MTFVVAYRICPPFSFYTVAIAIAAAPQLRRLSLSFKGYTESAAREFEAYLKAQWPSDGTRQGLEVSRASRDEANDPRKATAFFASSVVLDGPPADTWLELARAYLAIQTEQYDEKSSFLRNAGYTLSSRCKGRKLRA